MASDEELVGLVGSGDEAAVRELLRRYERPLSNFIYRHTAGQDVEDLFQETWVRVVRQARRFNPALRFSTWLFQIAINLCRDWHRRRRRPVEDVQETAAGISETASAVGRLEDIEARLDAEHFL